MTPLRLACGIPAYGGKIDAAHAAMWMLLGHAAAANEDSFDVAAPLWLDENPVADARNGLIAATISLADWLLMVDADTYYTGEADMGGHAILQMVRDAERLGAAVVAAPVRARGWANHERTVWMDTEAKVVTDDGKSITMMARAAEEKYLGKLVPVARIGAAFMAVSLRWLRDHMPEPPWFVHEPRMTGPVHGRVHSHGEDVAFCVAVRARGGQILCDGRILPLHVMTPERL